MLPLQEVLLRQVLLCLGTSSFFVVLRVYAVFARVALVFSGLFLLSQPPSARGRQSGPEPREEAVVISFLFQLSPEQGPNRALNVGWNLADVRCRVLSFGNAFSLSSNAFSRASSSAFR